jgi:hypothetical protein
MNKAKWALAVGLAWLVAGNIAATPRDPASTLTAYMVLRVTVSVKGPLPPEIGAKGTEVLKAPVVALDKAEALVDALEASGTLARILPELSPERITNLEAVNSFEVGGNGPLILMAPMQLRSTEMKVTTPPMIVCLLDAGQIYTIVESDRLCTPAALAWYGAQDGFSKANREKVLSWAITQVVDQQGVCGFVERAADYGLIAQHCADSLSTDFRLWLNLKGKHPPKLSDGFCYLVTGADRGGQFLRVKLKRTNITIQKESPDCVGCWCTVAYFDKDPAKTRHSSRIES